MKWETILKIGFWILNENRQVEYGSFLKLFRKDSAQVWVTWFYQSLSHTLELGSSLAIGPVTWLRGCSKPHHHGWCQCRQCRAPPAFCIEPKPAMNAGRRESGIRDTAPSFLNRPEPQYPSLYNQLLQGRFGLRDCASASCPTGRAAAKKTIVWSHGL